MALDLVREVRELLPDALRVEPRYAEGLGATDETGAADGGEPRTLPEHYQDWHAASGRPLDPRQADAFAAALAAAEPSP